MTFIKDAYISDLIQKHGHYKNLYGKVTVQKIVKYARSNSLKK
jgi:hypothetical protein